MTGRAGLWRGPRRSYAACAAGQRRLRRLLALARAAGVAEETMPRATRRQGGPSPRPQAPSPEAGQVRRSQQSNRSVFRVRLFCPTPTTQPQNAFAAPIVREIHLAFDGTRTACSKRAAPKPIEPTAKEYCTLPRAVLRRNSDGRPEVHHPSTGHEARPNHPRLDLAARSRDSRLVHPSMAGLVTLRCSSRS